MASLLSDVRCITGKKRRNLEKQHAGRIVHVRPDSLAEELGLQAGDQILAVNGQNLSDIIDLSFAFAEEEIELLVEYTSGEQEILAFDKEYDEELGVEFAAAVFDGIRSCGNRCYFCFVDQLASGMRESLSVKDDDYRMSFLYGNFVTMTNMGKNDFDRIKKLHLTPLFVSVHTTNGELRAEMLRNKNAGNIMEQLQMLQEAEVDYHTQIVLCPGYNDEAELDRTIGDLLRQYPHAQSLAIVPVGLTKYRKNCYPLQMFDRAGAARVIEQVKKWQDLARKKTGRAFVYLGDEFYFIAEQDLPETQAYDGFPQLDNGIGLTRNFVDEWEAGADEICNSYPEPIYLDIICGKSMGSVLQMLTDQLHIENLHVRVLALENRFWGEAITVSGLLTGRDILQGLRDAGGRRDGVILPASALRAGENIFLDDYSLTDLQREIGTDVKMAATGADLRRLLTSWHEQPGASAEAAAYTWQSNAAYTKNE